MVASDYKRVGLSECEVTLGTCIEMANVFCFIICITVTVTRLHGCWNIW